MTAKKTAKTAPVTETEDVVQAPAKAAKTTKPRATKAKAAAAVVEAEVVEGEEKPKAKRGRKPKAESAKTTGKAAAKTGKTAEREKFDEEDFSDIEADLEGEVEETAEAVEAEGVDTSEDKPKAKPVNVSVSETSDPTKAWNIYPVSRTEEEDGGAIGYSRKWIGYSYPGGEENTFVMRTAEAKAGKPATIYHFKGSLGLPVFVQDATDDMYFVDVDSADIFVRKLSADKRGEPYAITITHAHHGWTYFDYPPSSPQKDTTQLVASGDRNPKNLVMQNGSLWFSQAVLCEGRSAVQWHQVDPMTGRSIQTGLIRSDTSSFIQTSVAVNKRGDLLVGFQETSAGMFISPRLAYRKAKDKKGTLRPILHIGEGEGHTDGESWGDYSGAIMDGDNLLDLWTIQSRPNRKGRSESLIAKLTR